MSHRYWIIGPGRLGLSLGSVLADSGSADELVFVGRGEKAPAHSVFDSPRARYLTGLPGPPPPETRVLVTVPDGIIGEVADSVARLGVPGAGCVVIHFSGAQPAEVLAPLAHRGYATGSLHPLQTIADPEQGAERLVGACFTFEGHADARRAAAFIIRAAGGRMLEVHAADKSSYHAACVFASNYVVVCAAVATQLLAEAANITREEASRALQPLWSGAVANLLRPGLPRALTGPVARGDVETVKRHLAGLNDDTRRLYGQLALEALNLSRELGLEDDVAATIESYIRRADAEGSGKP